MKKFIKGLLFIILITVIVDRGAGYAFQYFYRITTTTDENKITATILNTHAPILFMGSSRCHHHYIPSIIGDSLQCDVYNAGLWGMRNIYFQYGLLCNTLERYHPRIILLEIHPIDYLQTPYSGIERVSSLAPFINYSSGCDEVLKEANLYYKCKLSCLYRYNSEWANVLMGNLSKRSQEKDKGFKPLVTQLDTLHQQIEPESFFFPPDERKIHYLHAFINKCKSEKIDLIFLYSPMYATHEKTNLFHIPDSLAQQENILFINHYRLEGITGHTEYYADFGHLNERGAEKYSSIIATELKKYLIKK
ncbi:MAG: hypothetical protein RR365_10650 [Bacteroides sp.]